MIRSFCRAIICIISIFSSISAYASDIPTIHSIPGYGNWNDPLSWSEGRTPTLDDVVEINSIMTLDVSPTVAGIMVNSGASLSGPYNSLRVHGNIENHGNWNIANTYIYGVDTILDSSTPIGGSLTINTTVHIPRSFDINGALYFNDSYGVERTLDIAPGQGLNIASGMSGLGEILGSGTFINFRGGMNNLLLTGSLTTLNLIGDIPVVANSSLLTFKNINLLSGATFHGDYPPTMTVVINSELITINSGATFGYFGNIIIYSSVLNHGTLAATSIPIYGNIENHGNWNVGNTHMYGLDNTLDSSTPLGGSLTVNTTLHIPRSLDINGVLYFNDSYGVERTLDIASGQGLNVASGMSGLGEILGSGTFINFRGGMNNLLLTGSSTTLNLIGDVSVVANISLLHFKNINLLSGATLHSDYPPNMTMTINSDLITINSGATFGYFGNVTIYSSVVNHGNIQGGNFIINGNIQNSGIWSATTYASWLPAAGATSYTIQFDPGTGTGFITNSTSYNITDKIGGSYYYQVTPDNSGRYDRKCINIIGCISGGTPIQTGSTLSFLSSTPTASATGVAINSSITLNFSKALDQSTVPGNIILRKTDGNIMDTTALSYSGNSIVFHSTSSLDSNTSYMVELRTGLKDIDGGTIASATSFSFITVTAIPKPTGLNQQIRSLGQHIQTIQPGEKIGKYQSGSGVILSGSVTMSESSKLVVDVYRIGDNTPKEFSGGYSTNGIKEVTIPYLDLGAGLYRWKARIETASGDVSDWVDFGTDNPGEIDYILYEGFEPYPYGYKFENSSPAIGILTGGISKTLWTGEKYKVDGNKWKIFNKIFPEYVFKDTNAMLDSFEQGGLNSGTGFQGGNCFGMSVSSAMQYTHPYLLHQYFPDFSTKVGTGTIWDKIDTLDINSDRKWDVYDNTIETILELQLTQYDDIISKRVHDYIEAIDAYNTLKDNPHTTYVLNFFGTGADGSYGGHAVIPYKVESLPDSKRIYIWDNNYPVNLQHTGAIEYGYNQYVDIPNIGRWKVSGYNKWKSFDKISLVSLDSIDYLLNQLLNGAKQSLPMGFNGYDMLTTLSGKSDIIISDSLGRVSGFSGGTILEGIPGVQVIVPLNATLTGTTDNTWKQIYLPQKQDGLTFKVSGKTGEKYDLMIAGGDYYTKVAGVTTSMGQSDSYQVTGTGLIIDFDNQKTGNYSLLTDNFQSTLTGTIFLSGIVSTPSPQNISYDWNKVSQKSSDTILYQIDTNNDGIYDVSSNYSATPTSPQATGSISGYIKGNTNTTMAGWKVVLTKQQDPVCKEGGKRGKDDDKQKNKDNRECRNYDDNEKDEKDKNNKNDQDHDDRDDRKDREDREDREDIREIFAITDKKGYYRLTNLSPGTYSVSIESQKNWTIIKPQNNIYNITLTSGQNIINLNFENIFLKGKNK